MTKKESQNGSTMGINHYTINEKVSKTRRDLLPGKSKEMEDGVRRVRGMLAFPAVLCYSLSVDAGGVLAAVFICACGRPDLFSAP